MTLYDDLKKIILPLSVIKKVITSAFGVKGIQTTAGPGNEGIDLGIWIQERIDDGTIDIGSSLYTNEDAQDAIGAILDATLVYEDNTPLLTRAEINGDVLIPQGSNVSTIQPNSVDNEQAADMLTNSIKCRPFATNGDPFDLTLGPNQTIGRGPTGDILALTLGTNLSIAGSTINAAVNAAGVPNTPSGNIAATNVQSALNELDNEKQVDIQWQDETSAVGSAGTIHTVNFTGAGVIADSPLANGVLTVTIPGGTAYTAGAGINISGGNVISNTSPDQTVVITGATGTYPNFVLPTNEVPLTFSNGLTRTVNNVTNDLITGKAGGQTIIGGTASGENLTLNSTSNATKGKIFFGASSAYDGVNMRLGINVTSPTSRIDILTNNIGVTQNNVNGLTLMNTTVAAAAAQQMSPGILWEGQGWKTTATAASQSVRFLADVLPVQGTTSPTGVWQLAASIDGGLYGAPNISISSDGARVIWGPSGLRVNSNIGGVGGLSFNGVAVANEISYGALLTIKNTSAPSTTGSNLVTLNSNSTIATTTGTTNGLFVNYDVAAPAGNSNVRVINCTYSIGNTGAQTGNTTGIFLNAAETTLNSMTHNLMDLQIGGVSSFKITGGSSVIATLGTSSSNGSFLAGVLRTSTINSYANAFGYFTLTAANALYLPTMFIFNVANASNPALKRNGATLETRLGNDSDFAAVQSLYQRFGSGSPEGVITAPIGATYHRTDGGAGTSFYVKESGVGSTGWVAK